MNESTQFGSQVKRKLKISMQIDEDLAGRVERMKKQFKAHGLYFSVSLVLETALERALKDAEKKLDDVNSNSDSSSNEASDNTFF